ncbi:MAG TPA: hypothetical protein PKD70_13625 [Saprospiraceae bacterium]|nr:hypothetical protein [Saprospiraceae bacterium]HMP14914.1 hypothetical protein [Saprospiraceae bacterium]
MRFFTLFMLCFLLSIGWLTRSYGQQGAIATSIDSVQSLLRRLAKVHPQLVGFIPETDRLYLITPRQDALPPEWVPRLQDAFYYDVHQLCRFYGYKYLADWRVLLAKASRETFWGASYLCNRAYNYFGIRQLNKPWACASFFYCETVTRNDPEPAEFIIFDSFETSLWMFIHTIYSHHFLQRFPDMGARVVAAIQAERYMSIHYWELADYGIDFPRQLLHEGYTDEEIIYTWSEHPINNLCLNCSRQTDREWITKVVLAEKRARI